MWIGGDAIMLAFIMIAVWMWSRDDKASLGGWLEAARKSRFDELVAGHAPGSPAVPVARGPASGEPSRRAAGGIDDDEHLAAYNAYLARLNSVPGAGDPPP
jgi:hypothetical protein